MFRTNLEVRVVGSKMFQLLQPILWETEEEAIAVPAGFLTDFASIPQIAQGLISINGPHRRAAVLHDYLFVVQDRNRSDADSLFLKAMRSDGVGWLTRSTMYSAVRIGGWVPWNANARQLERDPITFLRSYGLDSAEWGDINEV